MERWRRRAEGGHDGSESRCEIVRARKFNDVAGGGAHKVGKSRGGVGVEVRKMREVSQARGFAAQGRKALGKIVQGHEQFER